MDGSTHGFSCCAHYTCRSLLAGNVIVRFQKAVDFVDDEEQSVITTYHVLNGIDHCCVGFLKTSY